MENKPEKQYIRAAGHPDIAQSQIVNRKPNQSPPSKRLPGANGKEYIVLLDKLLGKGAFAQVYQATLSGQPQTKYAVKMVSTEHLSKWGAKGRENLEHEISILRKIKHRNIVRLEDFIQTANNYYLVFEYCAGGDLREYLKSSGALDEWTAQRFIYQLGLALKQLSINEIMHRDLKPQNILLDRNGADAVLKLADFGLAKYLVAEDKVEGADGEDSDDEQQHTVAGTPAYMAPEVARHKAYGPKADLWSCGIVFLEMLVGNRPWEGCAKRDEGREKKAFFYRFSAGEEDLRTYGVNISPICQALLEGTVRQNSADRMSWSEFFEHPVVKQDPGCYRELVEQVLQEPAEYIQNSGTDEQNNAASGKGQNTSVSNSLPDSAIVQHGDEEHSQDGDKGGAHHSSEKQESNLVISVPDLRSSSTSHYVEDFIKSQDITCQAIELLHSKADFLCSMVHFELHEQEERLTQKPYQYRLQLRYIVFKLIQEIGEVIKTFSTSQFLGMSASKDSDEQCVQNQIETREHEELIKNLQNLKEMDRQIKSYYYSKIKVSDPKSENKDDQIQVDTILRVLHHDGGNSAHQQYEIVLNDLLLHDLKELHGAQLIPMVHKLHQIHILLSKELENFLDDITDGALNDKKVLGQQLLEYVVQLAEDGALQESNFGSQAYKKYEAAQFVCAELLRDLINVLKLSSLYSDQSQAVDGAKANQNKSQEQIPSIASFTFIKQELWNETSSKESAPVDAMFDLQYEKLLQGLSKMIARRIQTAKKSPYCTN